MLAAETAEEFGYDTVVFVPSFIPPHKTLQGDASATERQEMVTLALAGSRPSGQAGKPRTTFIVDGCEVDRGGVSYTVDTLDVLAGRYSPEGKPALVIGDDLASGFHTWKDPDGILDRADVIVARRTGVRVVPGFEHRQAHNTLLPVSSSDIRQRIAGGRPWRWLVPEAVAAYVESHGLYRTA